MVRALREKDTEIGQLQQQLQQLEVEVEAKDNQLQRQGTQLQERNTQIHRQQRELDVIRVRTAGRGYCVVVVMSSILSLDVRRTGGGYR